VATEVRVLRVAAAFCPAATSVRVAGAREQVTYWAGLIGLQVRATVPV